MAYMPSAQVLIRYGLGWRGASNISSRKRGRGGRMSNLAQSYKDRKLQRAFCDLHAAERAAFDKAQDVFYRREGIPARMGDVVRGSIAQFCSRNGVPFPDRSAREKSPRKAAEAQLVMWPVKEEVPMPSCPTESPDGR